MPNRITPVNPNASQGAQVQTINTALRVLDREAVVKKFNGTDGESLTIGKTGDSTLGITAMQNDKIAMQIGKYNSNRYGQVFYDSTGIPIILIGQAPDDWRMGIWQTKPGQNVLTGLGG